MKKERGRKWDGKSRISNDLYRKRFNEIFKKVKTLNEELMEGYEKEKKMREDEDEPDPNWIKGYNKWKKENEKK
tara:strand:+ start:72 stop:293 length:222 start_codon:yes stop_codon:yes gene_type:complete